MATRKVKRYNGMTGSDVSEFAGTPENDSNAGMKEAYDASVAEPKAEAAPAKAPSFKEAFASARGAGDKTFEWNGKKYTTEVAKPAAKPAASTAKAEPKAEAKPAAKYESSYDRSRREDREAGRDFDSLVGKLKDRIATAGSRGKALPLKSTKSESGNSFMGATKMKSGGKVGSASSRGDGIAMRGKTRGKYL